MQVKEAIMRVAIVFVVLATGFGLYIAMLGALAGGE
jgi:hypothetical protein